MYEPCEKKWILSISTAARFQPQASHNDKTKIYHLGMTPPVWPTFLWFQTIHLWTEVNLKKHTSGQIKIFHQPRFPWNKGMGGTLPICSILAGQLSRVFGRNIIWPDTWNVFFLVTLRWEKKNKQNENGGKFLTQPGERQLEPIYRPR